MVKVHKHHAKCIDGVFLTSAAVGLVVYFMLLPVVPLDGRVVSTQSYLECGG
jgi:hypothetical protein